MEKVGSVGIKKKKVWIFFLKWNEYNIKSVETSECEYFFE